MKKFLIFLIIFALGALFGYRLFQNTQNKQQVVAEKNTPKAFISEIYDKIKDNYWNNISDAELLELFRLSINQKGEVISSRLEDKNKLLDTIGKATAKMGDEQKNKLVTDIAGTVLSSLQPAGRSGLYTQKNEEQLKNTVANINPEKDLYKDLGLNKEASEGAIKQAFEQKAKELEKDQTPESYEKLKQLAYANEVLSDKNNKVNYDKAGVEPTIFSKILSPGVLYVQFKKFAPTAFDEFQRIFESRKDENLSALVFDLRGNVGGAIDSTSFFLGNFLGKGQYAFDFYRKGEYLPFKTPTDKLASISKYKQVVVLVDQNTQSSAEMLAASLKKYHVGVVVGVPTKGWGTVERVFALDNQIDSKQKYSVFLVHSLTLRDDNQPIEGRGVDPDINIKNDNWKEQLFAYYRNTVLQDALIALLQDQSK